MEAQPATSSRAVRTARRQLINRLEGFSECLDAERCDCIARVGREQLGTVCSRLAAVERVAAANADGIEPVILAVSELLDCLDSCDSASYQAVSLLRRGGSWESASDALALLCSLPRDPLEQPCLDECSVLSTVIGHATSSPRSARASAWTALFALAVRNGVTVAASSELCESVCQQWIVLLQEAKCCADNPGELREAVRAVAAHRATQLATCQGMIVAPADVRAPLEAALARSLRSVVTELAGFSNATVQQLVRAFVETMRDEGADSALAVGAANACQELIVFRSPAAAEAALVLDAFPVALRVMQRLCPSVPEPTWWVHRIRTVDVRCVELWGLWTLLGATHILETSVPARTWIESDWWQTVLELAAQTIRVNELAGALLDDQTEGRSCDDDAHCHDEHQARRRRCVNFGAICYATRAVEAAARGDSQQRFSLLTKGLQSSILYSFRHGLSFLGLSLRSAAASALVALMGTLGEEDDFAVLDSSVAMHVVQTFCDCFDQQHSHHMLTVGGVLAYARELQTCLVSDANKLVVLHHKGVVDALVRGLLLDSSDPRVSQTGANTLREICAGALLQLTVLSQGAAMLRAHDGVVCGLASLCCCDVPYLRVYAEHTLHRIDGSNDATTSFLSGAGLEEIAEPPANTRDHVMISHNQADQTVVAHIATALRSRGYNVSINFDIACSTVGTMCTAVNKAAAALVCVSRSYIESAVCRAEAMHIQQSDLCVVPLLLHPRENQGDRKLQRETFRLSGWARKMFDQKIHYSFLDETVGMSSDFDIRIDELARALGELGKVSNSVTAAIGDISVIQRSEDAEEKSSAALTSRLLEGPEQRRLVLTQVLEHAMVLLARSSTDRLLLDRRTKAQLRSRSTALLTAVRSVVGSTGSSSAHALCTHRWPQYVGESTGAVLSDVFRMDDLRSERDVHRVEFLLEFVEKLSLIMRNRLSVLTDHIAAGGQNCACVLLAALDHGMQILDRLGTNKAHDMTHRSDLLSLSTQIGFSADVLNKFDAAFCDMLAAACNAGRADAVSIAQLILNVEQLTTHEDPYQTEKQVSDLVAAIEEPVAALAAEQTEQAHECADDAKEVVKSHKQQLEHGQLEAEALRTEPPKSESGRPQQVQLEVEVAAAAGGDGVNGHADLENGGCVGFHAQEAEESCGATPASAAAAGVAAAGDSEEGEGEENDLLATSSLLPAPPHSSLRAASELSALFDCTGRRVVELPVVDLELAAQGSRLRKERMRLEARAASPASRGAV